MKPAIAWARKNILTVASALVIVVAIPVSWFFGNAWSKSVREQAGKAGSSKLQQVMGAKVRYSVPMPVPGGTPIELNTEPNAQLTEHFRKVRQTVDGQAASVARAGIDFNRGVGPRAAEVGRREHAELVPGLFPGPEPTVLAAQLKESMGEGAWSGLGEAKQKQQVSQRRRDIMRPKMREMEDVLLGKGASVYQALLDGLKAGGPAEPVSVLQSVQAQRDQRRDRILSGSKRELTAEEAERLFKELSEYRLGVYQSRARAVSLYATLDSFAVNGPEQRGIPSASAFRGEPSLINDSEFFLAQWDYWMLSDLASAIAMANRDESGKPTDVARSVVKRIERVSLEVPGWYLGEAGGPEAPQEFNPMTGEPIVAPEPTPAPLQATSLVSTNKEVSITGRTTSAENGQYDVRYANLTLVVSSSRLPALLEGLARTNYMTVVGLNLSEVDVPGDLARGYYYGTEHVVRAQVRVETVWLRAWTNKLMPPGVREKLGVPGPAEAPPGGN